MEILIFFISFIIFSREDSLVNDDIENCGIFSKENFNTYPVRVELSIEHSVLLMQGYSGIDLYNYLQLSNIAPLEVNEVYIIQCVGFYKSITFSHRSSLQNLEDEISRIQVTYDKRIPTGIVKSNTSCFLNSGHTSCVSYFMPMPGVMEAPHFRYPAVNETLWTHLQDKYFFRHDWIQTMSVYLFTGSIPSAWVTLFNISSVEAFGITGNNWPRPETLLGPLPNLLALEAEYNNLEVLPRGTFKNTPRLRQLVLNYNNLSKFPSEINQLKSIEYIELQHQTGFKKFTISEDDISNLNELRYLNLNGLHLDKVTSKLLTLPKLEQLNASGCWLKKIEDIDGKYFSNNNTLIVLDLSCNNLTELPRHIFSSLFNLNFLNLSTNLLSFLRHYYFLKMSKLTYLDLSWNLVMSLISSTFVSLRNLNNLNLSHNKLSVVHHNALLPLTNLRVLDLSHNELAESPTFGGKHWEVINLSSNKLQRFANRTDSVTFIQLLDLSSNTIRELQFENVVTLNLSHNSLAFIPSRMWKSLWTLKTLDLGGNKFKCCHNNTINIQSVNLIRNLNTENPISCFLSMNGSQVQRTVSTYNESDCIEERDNNEQKGRVAVAVGVPLGIISVSLVIIVLVIRYYRFELASARDVIHAKKRGLKKDDEYYKEATYDAYVCCSNMDITWITEKLIPNIENGPQGYRLCLLHREFAVGTELEMNIENAFVNSRKIIFLLSQHFIACGVCSMQLEYAKRKMFSEGRSYIILVELERLDRGALPAHLQYLMDNRTYLEWPQSPEDEQDTRRCWKRLRAALGDSMRQRAGQWTAL